MVLAQRIKNLSREIRRKLVLLASKLRHTPVILHNIHRIGVLGVAARDHDLLVELRHLPELGGDALPLVVALLLAPENAGVPARVLDPRPPLLRRDSDVFLPNLIAVRMMISSSQAALELELRGLQHE